MAKAKFEPGEARHIAVTPAGALKKARKKDVIVAVTMFEVWDPTDLPECTDDTHHAATELGHWIRAGDWSTSAARALLKTFIAKRRKVPAADLGELDFGIV